MTRTQGQVWRVSQHYSQLVHHTADPLLSCPLQLQAALNQSGVLKEHASYFFHFNILLLAFNAFVMKIEVAFT